MDNDIDQIKAKVKRELADFLGVDIEDIEDETDLKVDLHMTASNLTDFTQILAKSGYDTDGLDLTQIETFLDLIEALTAHQ